MPCAPVDEFSVVPSRKLDTVLRHSGFCTGEAGEHEHDGGGIFLGRRSGFVHSNRIRGFALFAVLGFGHGNRVLLAVNFTLVIGQSHFAGQREVGNLYGETRGFEAHCREA